MDRRRLAPGILAILVALTLIGNGVPEARAASCSGASHEVTLSNGTVSPGSGTTATSFTFSVVYKSNAGCSPTRIVAIIGGVTDLVLTRTSGSVATGATYRGTRLLPLGQRRYGFSATGGSGKGEQTVTLTTVSPTIIVITAPPTPTPKPTPTPTPTPKPTPTPTPRPTATPRPTPTPTPTPTATPRATPTPTPTATPTPTPKPTPTPTATPKPGASSTPGSTAAPKPDSSASAAPSADPTPAASDPSAAPSAPGSPDASPEPSPEASQPVTAGGAGTIGGAGGSGGRPGGGTIRDLDPAGGAPPYLLVALLASTVGGLALLGWFVFAARRRRDPDDPTPQAAGMPSPDPYGLAYAGAAAGALAGEAAIPRWRRQSLREARARSERDVMPIVPLQFVAPPTEGIDRRVVAYNLVRMASEPDELLGEEVGRLDRGDEVDVLDKRGVYLLVQAPDGSRGWVHRTTLEVPATPEPADEPEATAEPADADAHDGVEGEPEATRDSRSPFFDFTSRSLGAAGGEPKIH